MDGPGTPTGLVVRPRPRPLPPGTLTCAHLRGAAWIRSLGAEAVGSQPPASIAASCARSGVPGAARVAMVTRAPCKATAQCPPLPAQTVRSRGRAWRRVRILGRPRKDVYRTVEVESRLVLPSGGQRLVGELGSPDIRGAWATVCPGRLLSHVSLVWGSPEQVQWPKRPGEG